MSKPIEQTPYCLVPRQLLADLRDNPLAIGVYLLVARLYLVSHAPVPLSRADVLRYDPSLKTGAVKRAFDRLTEGGWLIASSVAGSSKRHYTPTWGPIGGVARPWCMGAPGLGRPRHLATLRVNRDLLDVGLGRLAPHLRHAAEVTRYLEVPALSLADVGAYALALVELRGTTPTLVALGLVAHGRALTVLPAAALLKELARRAGIALSEHGRRWLEQPLVPGPIGPPIGGVIGELIGPTSNREAPRSALRSAERADSPPQATIPGISSEGSDSSTPPPTRPAGGGAQRDRRAARRTLPAVPETEASVRLRAIQVRPAQQIELADMPLAAIEQAIADGQARPGIRDLAGWVVYLLRQRRDSGWAPAPPAPRADAPEALGVYFKQLATEQEQGVAEVALASAATPALPLDLWQDTLAQLRLRLPREVYQAVARQAELVDQAGGVATIAVADARLKGVLEHQYANVLRLALSDAVGREARVRLIQLSTNRMY